MDILERSIEAAVNWQGDTLPVARYVSFGTCPICRENDGVAVIGSAAWGFCLDHKYAWLIGLGLFGNWYADPLHEWELNRAALGDFTIIVQPREVLQ